MPRLMQETNRSIPLGGLGDPSTDDLLWSIADSGQGYNPTYSPTTYPSAPINPNPSFDWGNLLTLGVKNIASPILNAQFGGPQPGQFFSTNAKTGQTVAYSLPTSTPAVGSSIAFPGVGTSLSSLFPILLLGGGVIFAFKLFGK